MKKDIILKSPHLSGLILGKAENNLQRNEFRAGDYIRFGRVGFHIKETSSNPIEGADEAELSSDESIKSLDYTDAEAINAAALNATVIGVSDKNLTMMGKFALQLSRQQNQAPNIPDKMIDNSAISVPIINQNKLSATALRFSNPNNNTESCSVSELADDATFTGRIGLCEGNIEEEQAKKKSSNPLVSPCKGAGTMRYIHYICLKAWIDSKKKVKSAMHITSYYWRDIRCELGNEILPDTVEVKNKTMKIVDYHVPKGSPYAVLETYSDQDK